MKSCDRTTNKVFCTVLLAVGLFSLAVGILWHLLMPEASPALTRAAGFLSGAGTGLTLLGTGLLIRLRVVSPEKLKQEQIERSDERALQVRRMALSISSWVGTGLFAVLSFVLLLMGYSVPAALCVGALYVQCIALLVAMRVIDRRV